VPKNGKPKMGNLKWETKNGKPKVGNQKSSCQFLRYLKTMYNSYYNRVETEQNPDVIGIAHDFLISKKLARVFLVSKLFLTRILHRSHC
jgi:hypothetical protein